MPISHSNTPLSSATPVQADPRAEDPHKQTITERVEASFAGEDRPMEKQHPTAPGAIVWFTFPAILIVLLLLSLLYVNFWPST